MSFTSGCVQVAPKKRLCFGDEAQNTRNPEPPVYTCPQENACEDGPFQEQGRDLDNCVVGQEITGDMHVDDPVSKYLASPLREDMGCLTACIEETSFSLRPSWQQVFATPKKASFAYKPESADGNAFLLSPFYPAPADESSPPRDPPMPRKCLDPLFSPSVEAPTVPLSP